MSSFYKRQLRVTFTLTNGSFEGSGLDTLTLSGLRTIVDIKYGGGAVAPTCSCRIYGMKQSDMNQLTMLAWKPLQVQRNTIRIEAFDATIGWSEIFKGDIIEAGPNYHSLPDAFLNVQGMALYFERVNPAPATSYTGGTAAADIMATIAQSMGLAFENNGVDTQLSNPYLPNTRVEQYQSVQRAANLDVYIEGSTMAVTPKGVPRAGVAPVLSPQTGLVGYPTVEKMGINFLTLYTPGLRFGGRVTVQGTDVPKANGTWRIYSIAHQLESERPDGRWHSKVYCTDLNVPVLSRG